MKIGLIKECKVPADRRVVLTPKQCQEVQEKFPHIEIIVETSNIRCYSDDEYTQAGIPVVSNMSSCDILLGVKEVPKENLIANKTYCFFSHTIKKQAYNRSLLQKILEKNITLLDYEVFTNAQNKRVVAFGRYAGLVGAYNGILAYGKRYQLFDLKPAHQCFDKQEMEQQFSKVKLPPIKIAVTGGGRVAKGAIEILEGMNIRKVSPESFLNQNYTEAVYTQLRTEDYNTTQDGSEFVKADFYKQPQDFKGDFIKYTKVTDILIAAAYWDINAPVLFTKDDMRHTDFRIKVIADVTCDIEGSIPSTKRASTISEPFYDYNPDLETLQKPLSDPKNITVMAVDNLPCELPRDASKDFGADLIASVFPYWFENDTIGMIKRATITKNGKLTTYFEYLQDYVDGE